MELLRIIIVELLTIKMIDDLHDEVGDKWLAFYFFFSMFCGVYVGYMLLVYYCYFLFFV